MDRKVDKALQDKIDREYQAEQDRDYEILPNGRIRYKFYVDDRPNPERLRRFRRVEKLMLDKWGKSRRQSRQVLVTLKSALIYKEEYVPIREADQLSRQYARTLPRLVDDLEHSVQHLTNADETIQELKEIVPPLSDYWPEQHKQITNTLRKVLESVKKLQRDLKKDGYGGQQGDKPPKHIVESNCIKDLRAHKLTEPQIKAIMDIVFPEQSWSVAKIHSILR